MSMTPLSLLFSSSITFIPHSGHKLKKSPGDFVRTVSIDDCCQPCLKHISAYLTHCSDNDKFLCKGRGKANLML